MINEEDYKKLSFERKVDVLVAQHVMKLEGITIRQVGTEGPSNTEVMTAYYHDGVWQAMIPLYSTLVSHAWDIVRKHDFFYIYRDMNNSSKEGLWECRCSYGEKMYGWAGTEMLAMCFAALKAAQFDVRAFLIAEGKA